MFCMNCGAEIPDNSNFCSKCGKNLSLSNDNPINPINRGKCLFTIERESRLWYGIAVKIKIYIDDKLVKELSNGEEFSLEIDNGKHNLRCEMPRAIGHTEYEFIGNSNKVFFTVNFPSMSSTVFEPFKKIQLILVKVKETEPGTFK